MKIENIKLPVPNLVNDKLLLDALNERRSTKSYLSKDIDMQTLSNILWAAYGVNNETGLRTIPTARNLKNMKLYVAKTTGVWLYNAEENLLKAVCDDNIWSCFDTQPYVKDIPLMLIYTGEMDEHYYAVMHAGSAYQNVALYATSVGLGTVVRGLFDFDKVSKYLNLPENEKVIITQGVGFPK